MSVLLPERRHRQTWNHKEDSNERGEEAGQIEGRWLWLEEEGKATVESMQVHFLSGPGNISPKLE